MDYRDKLEDFRAMLMGRARSLRYVWDWPAQLEIDDIVSTTMAKAIEGYSSFRGETDAEFGSWLLVILEHETVDALRRYSAAKRGNGRIRSFEDLMSESRSRLEHFLDAEMSSVSDHLRKEEMLQKIYTQIELLPPQQREALLLRFIGGLKISEMAILLNISERAVADRIKKGIARLQELFRDDSDQDNPAK